MPKNQDFQKELKEKIKAGVKPSKLKRSKSTEYLTVPKPEIPLTKSKSAEEITSLKPSLAEQVKQLKAEVKFWEDTAQNYLQRLQQLEPELDNKDNEIKQLKETNNSLVDKNNELRLQALKDADQIKEHDKELEKAVNKLVSTEQTQINYKVQNSQLLREKSDLEKRLQTAEQRIQKLYQLKGLTNSFKEKEFN